MRQLYFVLFSVVVCLLPAMPGYSQVCGDNNNSGAANVGDIPDLIDYLLLKGTLINHAQGEVDNKAGVTILDYDRLLWYLFVPPPQPPSFLMCPPAECYDLTISMQDTVILPMARCLPQSLGTLSMPIETRLHSTTTAFYFPVNNSGNGSNALYSFTGVNLPGGPTVNLGYNTVGTTTLLMGADRATTTGPPHSGIQTMFELEYARTISGPGYGAVTTGMIDVDWDRRFVVEKESAPNVWPRDLYRPVVLYRWLYDYPEGDLNCDCIVDVSDLTDIISFLFISFVTPLPCPCMPF